MTDVLTETRDRYRWFRTIPTRWMDNDVYGHVNNVIYYSWFDTAINSYLIEEAGLDFAEGSVIGVAAESMCRYRDAFVFPEVVEAGLRVGKLGTSSVRYEVGLFRTAKATAAAFGHFVHVFVDRATRRPTPIPETMRAGLQRLIITT